MFESSSDHKPTVSARAREALRDADNAVDAARLLEEWARKDPELWVELTEKYISSACLYEVRRACRKDRCAVWTTANYSPDGNGDRLRASGETSLLDFPLPGGKLLRDAYAGDLQIASDFYRKQARDMFSKSAWLTEIAKRIGRKKVATVFDNRSLAELKAEVCDE